MEKDISPNIEDRKLASLSEDEMEKYLSDWTVYTCSFCENQDWTTKEHIAGTFFFKPRTHIKEHDRKNETADTIEQKFKDWFKNFKLYASNE